MIPDRRASWLWLGATAVVFLADIFLHLPITDFCDWLATRYGFTEYDHAVRIGFVAIGACAFVAVWFWPSGHRGLLGPAMTFLVGLMLLAHKLIVVNAIESIHYPQYALLVLLLAPAVRDLEIAWIVATILGAIDEGYQAMLMPRGAPNYFDWNDVVLNGIGAAIGVVIVVTFTKIARQRLRPSPRVRWAIAAAVIAIAFLLAPPTWSPFFEATPGGRLFRRLAASEGMMVLMVVYGVIITLDMKIMGRQARIVRRNDLSCLARPPRDVPEAFRHGRGPRARD